MGFAMEKHLLGKGNALLMLRLAEDLLRCGAWHRASARPAWHKDVFRRPGSLHRQIRQFSRHAQQVKRALHDAVD